MEIGDAERRKFEADYLKRQQEREKRGQRGMVAVGPSGVVVESAGQDAAAVRAGEVVSHGRPRWVAAPPIRTRRRVPPPLPASTAC